MSRSRFEALTRAATVAVAASFGAAALGAEPFTSTFADGKVTVVDNLDGTVIVRPDDRVVVRDTTLQTQSTFTPTPDGFDVTVVYSNDTSSPVPLGNLMVTGFMIGRTIDYWDFRSAPIKLRQDRGETNFFTGGLAYPDVLYSPVTVFSDEKYTVGLSLLYPYTEYQHSITSNTYSDRATIPQAERSWTSGFMLTGSLPPGESRTYTIAVRLMRNDTSEAYSWLRTLLPYREYFQATYGAPRYERDARPVWGVYFSFEERCEPGNPRGWADDNRRPDLFGWEPWVSWLGRTMHQYQFDRLMIWCPSGNFQNNKELNFPFLALSPLKYEPSIRDSFSRLQTLPHRGPSEVGYWWGHSQWVMKQWDTSKYELFDPANASHVSRGLDELRTAVDLGATAVGLDAFSYIQVYKAHWWLQAMKSEAPRIKFITELDAPDIIHHLGPTYVYSHQVVQPHVLADFIMPGHEVWAQCTFHMMEIDLGRPLTVAEQNGEIRRVADLGYVPVVIGPVANPDRQLRAASSWLFTVPEDIRQLGPVGEVAPAPLPPPPPPEDDEGSTHPDSTPPAPQDEPQAEAPAPSNPNVRPEDPRRTFRKPNPTSGRPKEDRLPPPREDRGRNEERSSGRRAD